MRETKVKHMLRSTSLPVERSNLLDVALDLQFSLEYTHRLKGRPRVLQIILQKKRPGADRFKDAAFLHVMTDELVKCMDLD
jgi:hypothetical protein